MKGGAGTGDVPEASKLPMLLPNSNSRATDLARGARGYLLWAAPITLIAAASALGGLRSLPLGEVWILLIIGTVWFGLTCLVNALRCGRLHCWIDGIGLPLWAVVGVVASFGSVSVSLTTFTQVLWGIVLLSFVLECVVGSYLGDRGR